MRYLSTRGGSARVDLSAALTAGLAPDGGLFVPERVPRVSPGQFDSSASAAQIAVPLLHEFFEDDVLAEALEEICLEAFDFEMPLARLQPGGIRVLELFHGPTAAFKDVGARFLASCMARIERDRSRTLTVLVATSGDTGAAVAAAFHRQPGVRVVILYPSGRVSPTQAHQLGCFGTSVRAFAVGGSFDDCQAMAKSAFADQELLDVVALTSANSISLGRLLPQMLYYAQASLGYFREYNHPLNFVIPSGNLGNATAAALARAMGLPIGRIVLATNANAVLPDFFGGSAYAPRASVATIANAMDVGNPSNFERLAWLHADPQDLRDAFDAGDTTDEQIRNAIMQCKLRTGFVPCPHTATAWHWLEGNVAAGDRKQWAIVATAHASKFNEIVAPVIGSPLCAPPALASLLDRASVFEHLPSDYEALRSVLLTGSP